jgi:hypothetical protein
MPACGALFAAQKPVENIDGKWDSPLDRDIGIAIKDADQTFANNGWDIRIRWAAARGASYHVERAPNGEPIRQSVFAIYAVTYASKGKCFFNAEGVSLDYKMELAREHLGGGRYGAPHFYGLAALKSDGEPVGQEVLCTAVDKAQGGIHVQTEAAPEAAATTPVNQRNAR